MFRKIEEELLNWKNDYKKPLMIIGVRQIGKTYTIKKFCEENYKNCLYFNLEREDDIRSIFESTIDPEKIIEKIEIMRKITFDASNTIIFIDEIQKCEEAITSLKYFCESEIPYKIICAGSLLGVKLNRMHSSFPVGKVTMKYMYPMDFEEFLIALGEQKLIVEIKNCYDNNKPILEVIHEKALDLYQKYLLIGGMPEVVNNFIINDQKIARVNFDLQYQILNAYLADMLRYTEDNDSIKNYKIYNSISTQLSRENNNFKYSLVDKDARRIRYEDSLNWLITSNMVLPCYLLDKNELPLNAFKNDEIFKLYLSDVGLLRAMLNVEYDEILLNKVEMYKGVLTENYVACDFITKSRDLFYYRFSKYEIDFLIKIKGDIIPVEVKSGRRTTSNSLMEYINKYKPKYAIRISTKNFGFENNIKSIPLYAVFCINK